MATHSIFLAWKIPWTEESGWLTVHGVARVGHDLATKPPLNIYPLNELLDERAWGESEELWEETRGCGPDLERGLVRRTRGEAVGKGWSLANSLL